MIDEDDVGFGEVETVKKGEVPRVSDAGVRPRGARVLVMGGGELRTVPLPGAGVAVIGRAPNADVRIDDPSISRRHASLHLGPALRVEDLGSANGTIVREERLAPHRPAELLPGDTIEVGGFTLIVQLAPGSTERLRRFLPHGYFEARVESECARVERTGSALAVGRLHVERSLAAEEIQEIIASELRSDEAAAAYGPGEYEFLLTDTTPERARQVADRILERAAALGGEAPRGGLAIYPRDGRTPEVLLAKACDDVRGTRSRDPRRPREAAVVIEDPVMVKLHALVGRIAAGSISVLVLGETGVGKEVVAEAIHRRSPRAAKPFLRLNCAALSEALIESELFGHEKGAFTGAVQAKPGLLESAQGGTVFLDEVGELPMSTQVKLLRVLEERMVRRVGALEPRAIDVRVVSATNRDLEAEITAGRFRQDLYFRLNGITIAVPPLRERSAEIPGLAASFVRQICRQDGRATEPTISAGAMSRLVQYAWPGNIRELRNVIERAVLLCGDEILPEHLPLEKMGQGALTRPTPSRPAPAEEPARLLDEMQAFERERIIDALERSNGNQTQAAKMLGIARRTLIKRLDQYRIERPRKAYGEVDD